MTRSSYWRLAGVVFMLLGTTVALVDPEISTTVICTGLILFAIGNTSND